MKKTVFTLLLAVVVFSASLSAAPLNQTQVPSQAKWLMHVDFQAFANSQMGQMVIQSITPRDQKKIDAFTNLLGSDISKDFYGLTVYGPDAKEENAVAMFNGKFDRKKLISILILNKKYSEVQYSGRKLHHWLDEKDGKNKVGVFAADDLIVISQSEPAVQAALDMLDGNSDSLASENNAPLASLVQAPEGAMLIVAADGLAELNKDVTVHRNFHK